MSKFSAFSAFSIPEDDLQSLKPYSFNGEFKAELEPESLTPSTDPAPSTQVSKKTFEQDIEQGKATECSYCGVIGATTAVELRNHYKKDYHRFNIKRKLRQEPVVSEAEFEKMAEELDESISGSDDDDSASSEDDEGSQGQGNDDVSALLKRTKLDTVDEEDNETGVKKVGSPFHLFTSEKLAEDKCYGVYKALTNPELVEKPLEAVKSLDKKGKSAVFMIGGGHFSGAIISHEPNPKQKPTAVNPYAHVQIIRHKGFHRYTTRRKQGGSQAANDNAGGKAKSAGSTLRRYNELALQQEIRELLDEWRSDLNGCTSIYIRANGKHNRSVLMNYDNAPIMGKDSRIRGLPFVTKRATAAEIKRAWVELTNVRVVDKPKEIKDKQQSKKPTPAHSPSPTPAPKKVEPTQDEKHTQELTQLIKKSRSPRVIAYLKSNKIGPEFNFQPASNYKSTPSLLFYAAAQGSHHVVTTLLTQLNADPTVRNEAGRAPYDLSADRSTKDAFQLARSTLGESAWDWSAAKVGPALTKADIDKRAAQEKEQQAKERQEQLNALEKQHSKSKQDKMEFKAGQGKKLTSSIQTTLGSDSGLRGLSDEARMRLERERRARAAEARFKKQ